jgi:WD40 repeat protein
MSYGPHPRRSPTERARQGKQYPAGRRPAPQPWRTNRRLFRSVPNGKRLASGSRDKTLRILDVQTGSELAVFAGHTHWVTAVAWTPDGSPGRLRER